QAFTDMPSTSTVQAPQCEVSQPMCGPVCARRSRSVWISSSRAGTLTSTALPLSWKEMVWVFDMLGLRLASSLGARMRGDQRAARHLAGHRGLVVGVAAQARTRRARLGGQARGFVERVVIDRLADQ